MQWEIGTIVGGEICECSGKFVVVETGLGINDTDIGYARSECEKCGKARKILPGVPTGNLDKIEIGLSYQDPALFFANAIICSHTDADTDPDGKFSCVHCGCEMIEFEDKKAIHKDTCPVVVAIKYIKDFGG